MRDECFSHGQIYIAIHVSSDSKTRIYSVRQNTVSMSYFNYLTIYRSLIPIICHQWIMASQKVI